VSEVPSSDPRIGCSFWKYSLFGWGLPMALLAGAIVLQLRAKAGNLLDSASLQHTNCWSVQVHCPAVSLTFSLSPRRGTTWTRLPCSTPTAGQSRFIARLFPLLSPCPQGGEPPGLGNPAAHQLLVSPISLPGCFPYFLLVSKAGNLLD
jgi:hypothetical protein